MLNTFRFKSSVLFGTCPLLDMQLGETKLICWSTGPTNPILSKSKKIILQNFDQLAFFKYIIFCFLNKKNEIKHNKLI